jgi:Flp pilus assembly protein TadG
MTMRRAFCIFHDQRGAAAAELALIVPLLITLMFGSFELGNYFWSEHKVVKGVRDAARFAGRQSFTKFSCSAVTDTTALAQIKNLARTGQISGGTAKIGGWVDGNVTVAVACASGTQTGIYKGMTNGAPIVTVTAAVAYPSLFQRLGFTSSTLTLNASSQSAVMGI